MSGVTQKGVFNASAQSVAKVAHMSFTGLSTCVIAKAQINLPFCSLQFIPQKGINFCLEIDVFCKSVKVKIWSVIRTSCLISPKYGLGAYVYSKGADQPAHLHSLIRGSAVCFRQTAKAPNRLCTYNICRYNIC